MIKGSVRCYIRGSKSNILPSTLPMTSWNTTTIFRLPRRLRHMKYHFINRINRTTLTSTLREEQYTFSIISLSVLLRMRNISEKHFRENETPISCSITFFFENSAICEIMWKNIVKPDRPQMTIWCMRIAC
jgi:hypothetical protein